MSFYSQPYYKLMKDEPSKFMRIYNDHLTKIYKRYINSIDDNYNFNLLLLALLAESIENENKDGYSPLIKEFLPLVFRTKKAH